LRHSGVAEDQRRRAVPRKPSAATALRPACRTGYPAEGFPVHEEPTSMTALRFVKYLWPLLALAPISANADTVRILQTNSGGDTVNVIDPVTNKTVGLLEGIEASHGVTGSPDGTRIYVSNESESTLDVFDSTTLKLIKKVKLSGHPNNIAVAKDGRIVVAIARDPGSLEIIDGNTLESKKRIQTHGRLHNTYVTADSKFAIMGSTRTNIFTVVDLQKEEVAWELDLKKGVRPMTIESNPDGSATRVFIQVSELDGFRIVDFAAKKEVGEVVVPKLPNRPDFIEHRLDSPSHGIGVAPDQKTLWVTSIPQNAVFVYDLADMKLKGHVDMPTIDIPGRKPISTVANWVTFTPDGKQIYISNAANNSVTAVDTAAMKINAVIPVGQAPKRVGTVVMH
jgi:YVTN family beta-propeller protein